MTGARLRSTAGSGLAPVICCLTVRKKTGVGGGVGNPLPSIQSRERFCTSKKAPLPVYRCPHSFAFCKRSAQRSEEARIVTRKGQHIFSVLVSKANRAAPKGAPVRDVLRIGS